MSHRGGLSVAEISAKIVLQWIPDILAEISAENKVPGTAIIAG